MVGTIPPDAAEMLRSCGIQQGDEIFAPDGFPEGMDGDATPNARCTVEHHHVRVLHPNVAWMLGESGALRVPAPGT